MPTFRSLRPLAEDQEQHFLPEGFGLPGNITYSNRTPNGDGQSNIGTFGLVMIGLVAAFSFLLLLTLIVFLERRLERASQAAQSAAMARSETPEERYRNIEKWLVNKKVEPHDRICNKVLQNKLGRLSGRKETDDDTAKKNRRRTMSVNTCVTEDIESGCISTTNSQADDDDDDDDEDLPECPICFDAFQPGEIVSWSPDPHCDHIFHHHCIKEWLLRNKECPFCRETFLPIDRIQGHMTLKKITELILAQQRRSAHCYYCVRHGVVQPPSSHYVGRRLEKCDMEAIQHRSECIPSLEALAQMRGIQDDKDLCCEEEEDDYCHDPVRSTMAEFSSIDEDSDEERSERSIDSNPNETSSNDNVDMEDDIIELLPAKDDHSGDEELNIRGRDDNASAV
jgi:hypothetical protein